MVSRSYHDFDMAIMDRGDGRYDVRVLDSPSGQAHCEFTLPFSDLELENFLLRIGRPRRGVRRLESPEAEAARSFGARLSEAIFTGDVGVAWQRSVDDAEREGMGLRLRLRLTEAMQLAEIPWEYLYLPTDRRHLVLSTWTPLVRYLDLPRAPRPLTVQPPLRMLAMVSSPSDYPALDTDTEWSKLDESLAPLESDGMVEVTRLERATLQELQRALRRTDYHVFHFIGHGGFDEQASEGVLVLESDEGRSRQVAGHELATILTDARSIRLAVLNSCEGARAGGADPFGGTAPTLVTGGIPAVVAMQFEITDRAAIVFAHELYAAVSDGYPVDAAVAEARRAIFGAGNDVEWGTPVLYMRTSDGHLFDFVPRIGEPIHAEPAVEAEIERQPEPTPILEPGEVVEPEQAEPATGEDVPEPEAVDQPDDDAGRVVDVRESPTAEPVATDALDETEDAPAPAASADFASVVEAEAEPEPSSANPVPSAVAVEPTVEAPDTSVTVDIGTTEPESESSQPEAPAQEAPAQEAPGQEVPTSTDVIEAPDVDIIETAVTEATPPPAVEVPAGVGEATLAPVEKHDQPALPAEPGHPDSVTSPPPRKVSSRTIAAAGAVVAAVLAIVAIQLGSNTPGEGVINDGDTIVVVRSPGITIDGNLSDWADVPVAAVAQHRIAGQTPASERLGVDSSGSFRIAYDDSGLYLAGEVADDTVLNLNLGDQIWRGDAIDLNLSTVPPDQASATPDADDFQITLTPADGNGVPAHALFQGVGADQFQRARTDTAISMAAVAEASTPYTVEAFIPWSVLGLSGPPDNDLAALFAVFDNDGEEEGGQPLQAVVLANLDGVGFQDPNTWGRLTLQP